MACACKGRTAKRYEWTSADGQNKIIYETEIQAKAKTIRSGGSYKPRA